MEANKGTGACERAVRAMRRLASLARESDQDVVRDALVSELRCVLELDSVTVIACDQDAPRHPLALPPAAAERDGVKPCASGLVGDPRRSVVLELRSPTTRQDARMLLAGQPRGLAADEVAVAAALIDVAAVVLGLLSAQHEAATDELTGCVNRRAVLVRLDEEVTRSQRTRSPLSCVMLDVDNLKQINDTFGHLEGDRVLREVGASLRGELRAYDLAARYGGDEFLALLPATNADAATHVATRMTAAAARIRAPANTRARLPVSVTFAAASSRPGDVAATMLQRVDQALLNAKHLTHQTRIPSRNA
jgi:diguanylate cyclase (GGDEF)-like protein